jgi:hypothetical protein
MSDPRFSLQPHVDRVYAGEPPELAMNAESRAQFRAWQQKLRAKVIDVLGLEGRGVPESPQAEHLESTQRDGYVEEKYALAVGEGVEAPVYLLVPEVDPPYRPIVVFHGHSPSVQPILGNYEDEKKAQEGLARDSNYAQALAQAGFLVCAVEQRGFGERLTDGTYGAGFPRSCRHLSFEYMMEGRTLVGERCWDGMCAISFMQDRTDVVKDVMGCTGNSGGGTTALWLSAIDERVTVSIPSCYFSSFKKSILAMQHCECNYVPHILKWAEMGDLTSLIAPRALRIVSGENDPIFPIDGVREQYETVERAYELADAPEMCDLAVHPNAHRYDHALSHEWFREWL